MNIEDILSSKPHDARQLNRYIKFIKERNHKRSLKKIERHHICPKAHDLFPEYASFKNHPWNRIDLTPREHFIAHIMLEKIYGNSQSTALWNMQNTSNMRITGRLYERLRIEHSNKVSKIFSNYAKGKISVKDRDGNVFKILPNDPRWLSGELKGIAYGHSSNVNGKLDDYILTKDNNGQSIRIKKNDPRWLLGEVVAFHKDRKQSDEERERKSIATKGKKKPKGFGAKVSASLKGKPKSEAHKQKIRETLLKKSGRRTGIRTQT